MSVYDIDLDKNPANFQPLTPLSFLERAVRPSSDRTAIIHGGLRRGYGDFYARSRRLASALAKRGIKRGDTVAVMLANTPAMLECHYGVPMTGGVLNTLNTRLDPSIIAFSLDHGEAKVLITDREFSKTMRPWRRRQPLVIDYDRNSRALETASAPSNTRSSSPKGSRFRVEPAPRRMGRDRAELHLRHHRRPEGRRLPSSRRLSPRHGEYRDGRHGQHPVYLDAADVPYNSWCFPWSLSIVAGTHVCLRQVRAKAMYEALADHGVTHLCGAPIVMST